MYNTEYGKKWNGSERQWIIVPHNPTVYHLSTAYFYLNITKNPTKIGERSALKNRLFHISLSMFSIDSSYCSSEMIKITWCFSHLSFTFHFTLELFHQLSLAWIKMMSNQATSLLGINSSRQNIHVTKQELWVIISYFRYLISRNWSNLLLIFDELINYSVL